MLYWPPLVQAVSITFDSMPTSLTESEFSFKFTVKGAKSATNYFKILLYKEKPTLSLAETWNGTSWYGGTNTEEYMAAAITSGTFTGEIKGKIKTSIEPGSYYLSMKRFTASGNAANDNIDPVSVQVNTSTSPASNTLVPTPIDTPFPTVVSSPDVLSYNTSIPTPTVVENKAVTFAQNEEIQTTPLIVFPSSTPLPGVNKKLLFIAGVSTFGGLASIGAGLLMMWRMKTYWYNQKV